MAEERDREMELSAWLDGELDESRAREIEAMVSEDPELAAEMRAMRGAATLLRREVDAAEKRVDMSGFAGKVMSAIAAASPADEGSAAVSSSAAPREAGSGAALFGRLRGKLADLFAAHKPALAAAATMLVILGGGSFYFLLSQQAGVEDSSPVVVQGGRAVIEDLSFGDGSAVVYRTESDVTVIWVTEE